MDYFYYKNGELYAEEVPLRTIAEKYGTPCYVYSRQTLERHWYAFDTSLGNHPHRICFSVKACSNIAILNILARLGSGFDIVSIGELERVIAAGGKPESIVYSGVVKQQHEIERALAANIYCFNVESEAELTTIQEIAAHHNVVAPVSFRINPDINPGTHPYIATGLFDSKFGIAFSRVLSLYREASTLSHIKLVGIDCHIGSQIQAITPFVDALERLLNVVDQLAADGITLKHIDLGGGLGVSYQAQDKPPHPSEFASTIVKMLEGREYEIILEPGRAIAANAGVFLTTVHYIKNTNDNNFLLVDGAMNDLLRPALYDAYHNIIPVRQTDDSDARCYDVVGPVCETGDFLGKKRMLAAAAGDILAVCGAGAYGFSMSSQYNSRPRAPEILVDRDKIYEIRKRETIADLFMHEQLTQ